MDFAMCWRFICFATVLRLEYFVMLLPGNIMRTNQSNSNLTNWDDHLDNKYGKIGTPSRDKYEEEYESFRIGVLIQQARNKRDMTQEQLAQKAGTTKNYISRIENNASDIRVSTLLRIIRKGLDGHLKLSLDI